ncbi:hypothetical protein KV580_12665 [Pseudomonas chlororaphis]|nr:hypothetical protein [Pseudomonas chlororaphis]
MPNTKYDPVNVSDYKIALPGQWFIGVISFVPDEIYIVPVNIFEGHNSLKAETLNNTDPRAINRYASGAPGERFGTMTPFTTYKNGNWLAARPHGQTHHTAAAYKYKLAEEKTYGFSLIKINENFAQLKFGSTSLNTKPGAEIHHSFSRATAARSSKFHPGSAQMPLFIQQKLVQILGAPPYNILHIARSND